jgi:hypothetical protein
VRARVWGLEGKGEDRCGHLGGGGVGGGGGDIIEGVALREVVEDDIVQGLHEVQCGELLVQLDEEVALEDPRIEGLHGSVVDAADAAHGGTDRLGDPHGALRLAAPVELLGDLLGVELLVIIVHNGVEARSTGHDGLDDGTAGQTAVPGVDTTGEVLDVEVLGLVCHLLELVIARQAFGGRLSRVVRGVHDRRQAVGEHRHDDALLAVDQDGKDAGVGHVLLQEASEAGADLIVLGLLRLAVEGVLVALRHLWACVWIWTRSGLLSDHKGPHA